MEATHVGEHATGATEYRYWAFISYSHADEAAARRLHKRLETYRIAQAVTKGRMALGEPCPQRIYPVFRDRDELASSAALGQALTSALQASRNLIVVCSPSAAKSRWVGEEVRRFKALGREHRVFCLIVAGEPGGSGECFPEAIRFRVGADGVIMDEPAEPIAADLRANADGERNATLKLIAGLLDIPYDHLRQRDHERRQRRLVGVSGVLTAVAAAFGAIALFALNQRDLAREQLEEATLRRLASESAAIVGRIRPGDESLAMQLTLAANSLRPHPEVTAVMSDLVFGFAHTVRRWELPVPALGVAVSPDGNTLAVVARDPRLRLYDLRDGRLLSQAPSGAEGILTSVAFSPKGDLVATGRSDGLLHLWPSAGGAPSGPVFAGHDGFVSSVTFVSDRLLATGGADGTVRSWDVATGAVDVRTGHDGTVFAVAVATGWGNLISASKDNTIIWWPLDAKPGTVWPPQAGAVSSLAVSPDRDTIVSSTWSGRIVLWDKNGQPIGLPQIGHEGRIHSVAYSRDGALIASAGEDRIVRLWDGVTGRALGQPMRGHTNEVASVAFGRDGRSLVSASVDGTVRLWSLPLGERLGPPIGRYGERRGIALSGDGKRALTKDSDGRALLWDVDNHRVVSPQDPALGAIDAVAAQFSADGTRLATLTYAGPVQFWDGRSGRGLGTLAGLNRTIAMAFSPDGRSVATVGEDGRVRLLPALDTPGLEPPQLSAAASTATAVAFDASGGRLVGALEDGTAVIWDASTGRILHTLGPALKGRHLRLAVGHRHVVAGASDGTVAVWDASTGQLIAGPVLAHQGAVDGVAVVPGDALFASSGHDKKLRFWNVQNATPMGAPIDGGSTGGPEVAFARSAPVFLWTGQGGIRLWPAPSQWVDVLCSRLAGFMTADEWTRHIGDGFVYRNPCKRGG